MGGLSAAIAGAGLAASAATIGGELCVGVGLPLVDKGKKSTRDRRRPSCHRRNTMAAPADADEGAASSQVVAKAVPRWVAELGDLELTFSVGDGGPSASLRVGVASILRLRDELWLEVDKGQLPIALSLRAEKGIHDDQMRPA